MAEEAAVAFRARLTGASGNASAAAASGDLRQSARRCRRLERRRATATAALLLPLVVFTTRAAAGENLTVPAAWAPSATAGEVAAVDFRGAFGGPDSSRVLRTEHFANGGVSYLVGDAFAAQVDGEVADAAPADGRRLATLLPKNLALGRPVIMSSIGTAARDGLSLSVKGDADKAVDGFTGTHYFIGRGCAETVVEADPWLRIDFGREVPTAVVRLSTRSDSDAPALGPVELYIGNNGHTWRENTQCNRDIYMKRRSAVPVNCLESGRYLFVVLRARGMRSSALSLCEVEVTPKGPLGTLYVLQTIGEMWHLKLSGLALTPGDRISIVKDSILCGDTYASRMDPAVLDLTSPKGERSSGDGEDEQWDNIQLTQMGIYKVCWCGAVQDCSRDEHFGMHVATLVINGVMMTVAGNGQIPYGPVVDGANAKTGPMHQPYGIVATRNFVFVSEDEGHRVRYLDLEQGRMYRLCGDGQRGTSGDGGKAVDAKLFHPKGLGISPDGKVLYIADSGSHRIRSVRIDTKPYSNNKITTVAGNGFRGFSGDGAEAVQAQLNSPTCVQVDLNSMMWICDRGNNRIRVVSLGMAILVPGTSEYKSNIILTAAGNGLDGLAGDRGDGGVSQLAQVGAPSALAVSKAFVNPYIGSLPSTIFLTEENTHSIRAMALDYRTYLGTISPFVGTGERGSGLTEGTPNAAEKAKLNTPQGIATDDGVVWASDTGNNRLLMMPRLEYVAIGCWRENTEAPWVPSIEDHPLVGGFLTGMPETRVDAIWKCALAALKLGYEVFALRRMGACATGATAYLTYQNEGSSTSCANGLGGSRDNSVYRFARTGNMVEQLGLIYRLAGREGRPGFNGDLGTAWLAELNQPTGVAISPNTKDVWIADTGNNRLRLIFSEVGPKRGHKAVCVNGRICKVQLYGNGLQPDNRLGLMPMDRQCGDKGIYFSYGFERNPVKEIPSASYTMKEYDLGLPFVSKAGTYRLCFCIQGAVIFGKTTACGEAEHFIRDAGVVHISGPDSKIDVHAEAGSFFDLPVYGLLLSARDRIRIVSPSVTCGQAGANVTSENVSTIEMINALRTRGNGTWSIWSNAMVRVAGQYTVCWCKGLTATGAVARCEAPEDFAFAAANLVVKGPKMMIQQFKMSVMGEELWIYGTGLGAGSRIRIVEMSTQCGSEKAHEFSVAVDPVGRVPWGMPDRITSDYVVWTGIIIRRNDMLKVCWCGRADGCIVGSDFTTDASMLFMHGPISRPIHKFVVDVGQQFDIEIKGSYQPPHNNCRINVISQFDVCGSVYALKMSDEVVSEKPRGPPSEVNATHVTYKDVRVKRQGIYKLCYCDCNQGPPCCTRGQHFFMEVGALYVNRTAEEVNAFNGTKLVAPKQDPEWKEERLQLVTQNITMWNDTIPKNTPRKITVTAKTRRDPEHAGSIGPIHVTIYMITGEQFPEPVVLEGMGNGSLVSSHITTNLREDRSLGGIIIENLGNDAWLCEYIDVLVEEAGFMRFSCSGWTVKGPGRQARGLLTENGVHYVPRPLVPIWETHYFRRDVCGGCPLGFECKQELMPLRQRMTRQWEDLNTYVPAYQGACRPICGDGYLVPGEECDDGNVRSLDGCSGSCKLEQGFECALYIDRPSQCFPRMCEKMSGYDAASSGGATFSYSDDYFAQGGSLGYMCSAKIAVRHQMPVDRPYMCFPWKKGICPTGKLVAQLQGYQFSASDMGKVNCSSVDMVYKGSGKECDQTNYWSGPQGMQGYGSYQACADECSMDSACMGLQFYINTKLGGMTCPKGVTPKDCGARCRLLGGCSTIKDFQSPASAGFPDDTYHVGRKEARSADEIGGDYFCSELPAPRPVWGAERDGIVVIQMDSATEPPEGTSLGEGFDCDKILTDFSARGVGGANAECVWVLPDTLHIRLGTLATLARPYPTDVRGQLFGDPSVVVFDSRNLKPRGIKKNYAKFNIEERVEVFVRREDRYSVVGADAPFLPEVVIRGPQMVGGCGSLDVSADVSSHGRGRRWASAKWTCIQTVPSSILSPFGQQLAYEFCETRIQPLLDEKSWCGPVVSKVDQEAMDLGIVRPCELAAVIPPPLWCGIGTLILRVELATGEGVKSSAELTTQFRYGVRLPTVAPVGKTELHISPQRRPGGPLPRVTLEVTTAGDIDPDPKGCGCNISKESPNDGTEAQVVVSWYYGEIRGGKLPALYDMNKVRPDEDESHLMNVLRMPLQNQLRPGSKWRFVARASYAAFADDDGATVDFIVHVGEIEPPVVRLLAPTEVCSNLCGFRVDASDSEIRELIYWSSSSRRLQSSAGDSEQEEDDQAQKLTFEWECKQLALPVDDAAEHTIEPDMRGALAGLCAGRKGQDHLFITQTVPGPTQLPPGLYVFTVHVSDTAFPDKKASASVTVRVLNHETALCPPGMAPVFREESPVYGSVAAEFRQLGFGINCPLPTSSEDGAALLLLRAPQGRPRHEMQAFMEVNRTKGSTTLMPESLSSRIFKADVQDERIEEFLQPGFVYAFQLLITVAEAGMSAQLQSYKDKLLQSDPQADIAAENRVVYQAPLEMPLGVYSFETEVFTYHSGPMAGTLNMLVPSNGKGMAMQDMFKFQQLWATDHPPLEYAYYYSTVSEKKRHDFEREVKRGFHDRLSSERLKALVPDGLVLFSSWARDPTLAAPLPVGMYVLEGRVRDALGRTASRFLALESLQPFSENATTAKEKLAELENYVANSRHAILQVRAANRGAVAVAPVSSAIVDLPDLNKFDFKAMLDWNENLGTPSPMSTQPIYGTPVVSRKLRLELIAYLDEVLNVLDDIVSTLDDFAIRAMKSVGRRLQDADLTKTTSHIEMLSGAFLALALRVRPVLEPELLLRIGALVTKLLERVQGAKGNLADNKVAAQNLLDTIATLLSTSEPITLPRAGNIEVNISKHVQARLSAEVIRSVNLFGDAISAFANLGQTVTMQAVLPSGVSGTDTTLQLTAKVNSLDEIITNGLLMEPDMQRIDRWRYPKVRMKGLGPPGFQAQDWAGEDTENMYKNVKCFGDREAFLDRISALFISWPISPVRYSSGSLVDVAANITMPYTVQLRSCGMGISVNAQPGAAEFTFRLDAEVVRDRRFGYRDLTPYRITWWEDVDGAVGSTADRIRRWTTQGCKTIWNRAQGDLVSARCDRLPAPDSGAVLAIELVKRPPYVVVPKKPEPSSMHNVCTYVVILLIFRFLFLWGLAHLGDIKFWPSEHDLVKIHFVPAEYRLKENINRKRPPPARGCCELFQRFVMRIVMAIVKALATIFGESRFVTLEIRELQVMRAGERDRVYEHFFDAVAGQATKPDSRIAEIKFAAMQMQQEQKKMIALAYSPDRRAAWSEAAAIADTQETWRHDGASVGSHGQLMNHSNLEADAAVGKALLLEDELVRSGDIESRAGDSRTVSREPTSRTVSRDPGSRKVSRNPDQRAMSRAEGSTLAISQEALFEGDYPDLPPGWEELYVEDEYEPYYHNKRTGQTTWDRPILLEDGTVQIGNQIAHGKPRPRLDEQGNKVKFGSLRAAARGPDDHDEEEQQEDMRAASRNSKGSKRRGTRGTRSESRSNFVSEGSHGAAPPEDTCAEPQATRVLRAEAQHASGVYSDADEEDEQTQGVRRQVELAAEAAHNSLEVILPYGWDMQKSDDGREYYTNQRAGITQWEVPRLPPHYEERVSADGRVYYLNLWNKTTQWEWPAETSLEMALPNTTGQGFFNDNNSEYSNDTAETGVANMADQFEAEKFLQLSAEMPLPGDEFDEDFREKGLLPHALEDAGREDLRPEQTHDVDPMASQAQVVPHKKAVEEQWGVNKQEEEWLKLKENLRRQKKAHESRFATARQYPGLREFIRPHEMYDQVNNWENQADEVEMTADNLRRRYKALGIRSELRKPELRSIFPIIQRLTWTKWAPYQIFFNALERALPSWYIYMNYARPSKFHRCLLHMMEVSIALLLCTIALLDQATVSEEVDALNRPVWTIFGELATAPWNVLPFVTAGIGAGSGKLARVIVEKFFFAYEVSLHRVVTTKSGQQETMMYWHELAQMGKWVCLVLILIGNVGAVALCSLVPQPRSLAVVRSFLIVLVGTHIILPILTAFFVTFVLCTARKQKLFDGLLCVFPNLMDFQSVGVVHPDFLRWRVERIVTELEQLKMVYRAEEREEAGTMEFGPRSPAAMDARRPHLSKIHSLEDAQPSTDSPLALPDSPGGRRDNMQLALGN